ncbi:head GIN domain-containing protein [Chitinophaga vietnamensis]|uniref:head GIN domain-containing protein n=1 Tax=Chitinophaga vietnamensis TaxID=2593957 RepID=UPI0011773F9C|nr:head GIN domain-containing protein [Chitinophaga vietnamensis]
MKIRLFLCQATVLFAAIAMFSSCNVVGQFRVKGSGNVIKEERKISSFHRLKVDGSMNVELSQGDTKAVVEADDNIVPVIELVNDGNGTLTVRFKRNTSISTHHDITVYLTSNEVDDIALAGSGDLKFNNKFSSKEDVKISLTGSGNVNGAIAAPAVKASISGSGNIHISGETRDVNVSIAGSGDFFGEELMAENASVKIMGSGDARVHASVKLDAKIAGSGDVKYKGTPQVSSSVAGSGTVQKI